MAALSEYFIDGIVVVVVVVAAAGVGADCSGESRPNRLDLISLIINTIKSLFSILYIHVQ